MEKEEKKPLKKRKRLNRRELITKGNLNDCVKDIFMTAIKRLNAAEERLDKAIGSLNKKALEFGKIRQMADKRWDEYAKKMESIEDTFFTLYHNIKSNQFLYADKPEEWWNDYLDLKRHYKGLLDNGICKLK